MGFVSQLQAEREAQAKARVLQDWKFRNRHAISQLPKEQGVLPRVIQEVIDGKRKTQTQQVERRLADLGCPGFEQYRQQTKGGSI